MAPGQRRIQLVPRSAVRGRGLATRRSYDLRVAPRGDFRAEVDAAEHRLRHLLTESGGDVTFVVDDAYLPGLLSRLTGELVDPDDLPPGPVTVSLATSAGAPRPVSPPAFAAVTVGVVLLELWLRWATGRAFGAVALTAAAGGVLLLPARRTRPWGWTLLAAAALGVAVVAIVVVFAVRIPVN